MHSTIDLFGPLGHVGDRNGHRFLWGAVCQATGVNFLQPLSAKSQSKEAPRLYSRHIDVAAPTVEAKLKYPTEALPRGRVLASDRDGAFTMDNGFTKSMADEMTAGLGFTPYFGSAGTPETASVQVEKLWQNIPRAADASILASGMLRKYYIDALLMAGFVLNVLPTSSNLLGNGEAPNQTLGSRGCSCPSARSAL